jgi:nucleotide-binding universal stress UspA family protein
MKRFKNILFYAPLDVENKPALRYAINLAKRNRSAIKVFDCIEPATSLIKKILPSSWNLEKVVAHDREARLKQMVAEIEKQGIDASCEVVAGNPAEKITWEVMQHGHDIVIKTALGTTNHKEEGFFSTTAIQLMRICPCPICVVDPDQHDRFERILVAVDPQQEDSQRPLLNQKILEMGISLAEREEAKLDILAPWSAFGESIMDAKMSEDEIQAYINAHRSEVQNNLDELLKEFRERIHPDQVYLQQGDMDRILLDFTEKNEVDMLVIGTMARKGISGMILGNMAEKVIHKIRCSVLAVKPDGFESPINPDKQNDDATQ